MNHAYPCADRACERCLGRAMMTQDVKYHKKQKFVKRSHGKDLAMDGRMTAKRMERRLDAFMATKAVRPRLARESDVAFKISLYRWKNAWDI